MAISFNHKAGKAWHLLQLQGRDREGVVISSNHRAGTGRVWPLSHFQKTGLSRLECQRQTQWAVPGELRTRRVSEKMVLGQCPVPLRGSSRHSQAAGWRETEGRDRRSQPRPALWEPTLRPSSGGVWGVRRGKAGWGSPKVMKSQGRAPEDEEPAAPVCMRGRKLGGGRWPHGLQCAHTPACTCVRGAGTPCRQRNPVRDLGAEAGVRFGAWRGVWGQLQS